MTLEPDAARRRGTPSGTVLALGFTVASVAFVLFLVFVSPFLRDQVLQREGGLSERDVLASGTFEGDQDWLVAAVLEDDRVCVVSELDGAASTQACAADPQPAIGELAVARPSTDPRWLVAGVLAQEVAKLEVRLADGTTALVLPRRAGSGVRASFWFTLVDAEAQVRSLTALDRSERVLGRLTCEPFVATRAGAADKADCQSGGQG